MSGKRKSPKKNPKLKRKTIDEATLLDSETSSQEDIIISDNYKEGAVVTFKETPEVIPISSKKGKETNSFTKHGQRLISNMFSKKLPIDSSPNISEPFTPPAIEAPVVPYVSENNTGDHISDQEESFIKVLDGEKLSELKIMKVKKLNSL